LSEQKTEIKCSSLSEDIEATMRCLSSLGASIEYQDGIISVTPIGEPTSDAVLDCGESGSTYRFLAPVVAALGVKASFLLRDRLSKRPMESLWDVLEKHGITISGKGEEEVFLSGKLSGGIFKIEGDISSQYISGLLMALPLLEEGGTIEISTPLESVGYIYITIDVLNSFGVTTEMNENSICLNGKEKYITPGHLVTEGDWSNSAFWLCGAAASGRSLTCTGLDVRSSQGDSAIIAVLREMGADIECKDKSVYLKASFLRPAKINAGNIPDLVPAIALAACSARGETEIFNAGRLRIKESDRLFTVADTLRELGAEIEERETSLLIRGGNPLRGGCADSHGDHRIVMMAALASLISKESITIEGAEAVDKSYPGFFHDFASLGAKIRKE
ncbi:MAG: 3-phosphoshikimate 1-carboxyvinyltransferase, partial [Synergistaceae bacterium]|nr:3-phosphoshikimate 1-carboxyvinyltransferase [Synergistaceae bacterium]